VVAEDTDLFLQDLTGLFSALRGLVGGSQVFGVGLGLGIKYTDPLIALSQVLVELCNLVSQGAHVSFHHLPGLLGGLTSLQGGAEVVSLGGGDCIRLPNPTVSLGEGALQL